MNAQVQTTPDDPSTRAEALDRIAQFHLEMEEQAALRPAIQVAGVAALKRLLAIAFGNTGQGRVLARFLLGCYNGARFPFDLTDFRVLDHDLFQDCMAVLAMDSTPEQEIHCYVPAGGQMFEDLARVWQFPDQQELMSELKALRRSID